MKAMVGTSVKVMLAGMSAALMNHWAVKAAWSPVSMPM